MSSGELRCSAAHYQRIEISDRRSSVMGRYLLLWMLGIPLPILVLIYMLGGLH
jgi:hypothetical protein